MNRIETHIQYIDHSGFSVETPSHQLIFDYFRGKVSFGEKTLLVFSSHSHPDHYNPDILSWQQKKPEIQYILSSDISVSDNQPDRANIHFFAPYQETTVGDVRIKTYGSTDEGVSFLIEVDGLRIFHAGDLNWWHWWGESPEEIAKAEEWFKREIAQMAGEQIDLAFFPVDPRLEQFYTLGADYFIEKLKPGILIPMHFGENIEPIRLYQQKMKASAEAPKTEVIPMLVPGETLLLLL